MYDVSYAPTVAAYLDKLLADGTVPPAVLTELLRDAQHELSHRAEDHHRRAPLAHESLSFTFETFAWADQQTIHELRLIVSMKEAASGVVHVEYAEHRAESV